MISISELKINELLQVARNYLGVISYSGTQISQIPQELKPFLDKISVDVGLDSLPTRRVSGNKKALFLDRDGVINIDHGYVGKAEQVELIPGICQLISRANHKHYDVNVVTNQSGIGRGYYSEDDYRQVMECIQRLLQIEQARIDHIEFAPYHPDSKNQKYLQNCFLRKPRPGMILKLAQQYGYNLQESIMIGDKASDLMSAAVAGVGQIYLFEDNQSGEEWRIYKNWLESLKKYGLVDEFDMIKAQQLTDFSEIQF